MIVLDTNIVSELEKPNCDIRVRQFLNTLDHSDVVMCSIVEAELVWGGEHFRIRTGSTKYLDMLDAFMLALPNKTVLVFDKTAARRFGVIKAKTFAAGKPRSDCDLMIAAICIANGATLLTRNAKDFEDLDVKVINPFEANV